MIRLKTGIIKRNLTHHNIDEAIETFYSKYEEQHEKLVKDNQEMHERISLLKGDDFHLGIVTGKARRNLNYH